MSAKKQIQQETFDECVRENVEDFEMTPEEAIQDAIKQFENQGVDLSNIIKCITKPEHKPSYLISLIHELGELNKSERLDQEDFLLKLQKLNEIFEELPESRIIAGRNNAVNILLEIMLNEDIPTISEACSAFSAICADNSDNKDFVSFNGVERLVNLYQNYQDEAVITKILICLRAVCANHETNKGHFIKAKGIDIVWEKIDTANSNENILKQFAGLLRVLTICDNTSTFSQAHECVKLLVAKDIIPVMIKLVKDYQDKPDVISSWILVMKQLAITEENCKKIFELSGLDLVRSVMVQHKKDAILVKNCISVFRNVAAADDLKDHIINCGGLAEILLAMFDHQRDSSLQQHACATIAAIVLRSPENSMRVAQLGAVKAITVAMRTHPSDAKLMRQASLAIRNMAARSVDVRPMILEEDVEELLREAVKRRGCGDEAYAALRDLGCEIQLASFGNSKASFNPINIESIKLMESIEENAEAPFAA